MKLITRLRKWLKPSPLDVVNAEIAALEARMGTDEWFEDKVAQERYRQLVWARLELLR